MIILSVARIKFIKTKVILSIIPKASQTKFSSNSDHKIKSYSCSNSSTKMGKSEKMGKNFWVTKRGNKGIADRGKRDYK